MEHIVVMNDHPLIQQALAHYILDKELAKQITSVSDCAELTAVLNSGTVDAVIMEVYSQRDDICQGIEFARKLSERWPATGLMIYTALDHPLLLRFFADHIPGATITLYRESLRQLFVGVMHTLSGVRYFSQEVNSLIERRNSQSTGITLREWLVLIQLKQGYQIKEIGYALLKSNKTISHYKRSLMEKFGCPTTQNFYQKLSELQPSR